MRRVHPLSLVILLAASLARAQAAAPDPYKSVLDRLQSVTAVPLPEWRSHAADLPHGEDSALDDSSWSTTKVDEKWNDGPRWLRLAFEVPEQWKGYSLRGTRLQLNLRLTSDEAIGISVFVNGSLVSRTDEDGQLPIPLTGNAQPGQKFVIAVLAVGSPVATRMYRAQLLVEPPPGRPDPELLRLEILAARPLIAAYPDGAPERQQQLDAAVQAIDAAALDRGDQAAFDASLRQAQQKLEILRAYMRRFTIRATGNSHIDMAWLWPWTETVEVVRNTFSSALQIMREYPDFTFTMASAQTYAWMEEKYPSLFQEIQQRVKEGRWEIVGGMWVEPDLNLPAGESLVRQVLVGKRYFRQKFGVDIRIGWNPDSFGYNWQLPQIYKRAGFDYFVTQKIYWNDTTKFPYKLFWWEAPDGSRLLTYFPHDYANDIDPVRMATDLSVYGPAMWKANAGSASAPEGGIEMMHLYGVGDHGGGPTRLDLDTARRWQQPDLVYPAVKFGTAAGFFSDLEKNLSNLNVPTWKDELYLEYHRGVQTTQSENKRRNREAEVLMLNAEKLATLDSLFGRPYPQAEFAVSWEKVLFNQFHDILPGSGIAINYVDAARKYAEVGHAVGAIEHHSLADLAARVNTPGTAVLVFNPLSWARTDVVEAEVQFPSKVGHLAAFGPDGKPVLLELLSNDPQTNRVRVRLLVSDVPALGYKLIRLVPQAAAPAVRSSLVAKPDSLENEFLRVTIDPKSGCITSLYDKRSHSEALALPEAGEGAPAATPDGRPCGNLLQAFADKPKHWDAWNIDADFVKQHWDLMQPEEVKLVENTPLRAVVRVRTRFQSSEFVQDITLVPGVPRVDVRMQADWHEKHILLKVAFPLSARNQKATFEIPFGSIERPTTRRTPQEQAKFEVPALFWADLSDATHGFSLLNASKYGYDARDNVLRLSLLRSPEWPDPHTDEGRHEFTYSLYPHGGTWREALTVRRGYELNYPLLAVALSAHAGPLPAARSFFQVDQENVVITAIKKAEDDDALIVRFYEWSGKDAEVRLHLPRAAAAAWETNLMEMPEHELSLASAGTEVVVHARPYEIKTVKLRF